MIQRVKVQNFKSLLDVEVEFSELNLLSGVNGLGKSSLLQIFLLLRQSFLQNLYPKHGILLNEKLVSLGKGKDILNNATDSKEIFFDIYFDKSSELKACFKYIQDSDFLPIVKSKSRNLKNVFKHPLFTKQFKYLNAERVSPQLAYQSSLFEVVENGSIGIHGEFTSLFLALHKRNKIKLKNVSNQKVNNLTLLDQVSGWLSEISPGFSLDSNYLPNIDYANLIYKFQGRENLYYDFSPPNVGFGMTYVLPVITLILSSKPGDILVIENPESHIHPQGQTKIGELLFRAAQDGVQLFVETHSDHILNGIRSAINKINRDSTLVKLLFFQRSSSNENQSIEIVTPTLDNNGRIDEWPNGFFDEWEKTLLDLI